MGRSQAFRKTRNTDVLKKVTASPSLLRPRRHGAVQQEPNNKQHHLPRHEAFLHINVDLWVSGKGGKKWGKQVSGDSALGSVRSLFFFSSSATSLHEVCVCTVAVQETRRSRPSHRRPLMSSHSLLSLLPGGKTQMAKFRLATVQNTNKYTRFLTPSV